MSSLSAEEENNLSASSSAQQNEGERDLEEMMQRTWEQEQQREEVEQGTMEENGEQQQQQSDHEPTEQDFTETVQNAWREEEKTETQWERNVQAAFQKEQEKDEEAVQMKVTSKQVADLPAPRKLESSLEEGDAGLEPLNKKQPRTVQVQQQPPKAELIKVVEATQIAVPPAQTPPEFPSRGIYKSLSAKDTALRERQRQLAATAFLKEKLFPWAQGELERKKAMEHNENAKIKAVIVGREQQLRAQRLERESRLAEQRKKAISDYIQAEQERQKQLTQEKAIVRQRIAEMDGKRREREAQRAKLVSMMY